MCHFGPKHVSSNIRGHGIFLKWHYDSCPPFAPSYLNDFLQKNVAGTVRTRSHLIKQVNEFVSRQSCLFNYGQQGTCLYGVMPWHGYFVLSILVS
jgi:hypothetical protein